MSIEQEIAAGLHSVEVEHELDRLAHKVADYAQSIAPVFGETGVDEHRTSPPEGEPGDYRDSIVVDPRMRRPGVRRVISRSKLAIWVEIGTRHMPEYAVFTKTAKYFGAKGGPSFSASGRDSMADEGVGHAHKHLRSELEAYAKLRATGAAAHKVAEAAKSVAQARQARSSAFNAARPRRGRR